jgi:hypothetical protein
VVLADIVGVVTSSSVLSIAVLYLLFFILLILFYLFQHLIFYEYLFLGYLDNCLEQMEELGTATAAPTFSYAALQAELLSLQGSSAQADQPSTDAGLHLQVLSLPPPNTPIGLTPPAAATGLLCASVHARLCSAEVR